MDEKVTLADHLKKNCSNTSLCELILHFEDVCRDIYEQLETSVVQYVTSENDYGEKQLNLDLIADEILVDYLEKSNLVSCYATEERPSETCFNKKVKTKYTVTYDPLDGSSVVDAGLAVGTVIGIYKDLDNLIGSTGRDQVAAVYVLYGSPIKIVYTTLDGVHIFSMNRSQEMMLEEEHVQLDDLGKICALGGFQHILDIPGFHDAAHHWMKERYALRYSGSMTADIHNILKKRGGIYAYPHPKLRLLYECNPLGLIFEQAGGMATDGERSVLDIPVETYDQQLPFFIGSKKDVIAAQKFFSV